MMLTVNLTSGGVEEGGWSRESGCGQQPLPDGRRHADDATVIVLVLPQAAEFVAQLVSNVALVRVLPLAASLLRGVFATVPGCGSPPSRSSCTLISTASLPRVKNRPIASCRADPWRSSRSRGPFRAA